ILPPPPAVDLTDRAHRQLYDRDRTVGQMLCVENHEVGAAILVGTMSNPHQIPSTLRRGSGAWGETTLVEVGRGTRVVQRRRAVLMIETHVARADRAASRPAWIGTGQGPVAIRHRVVAIILSRQRALVRIHLLDPVV